MAEPDQPPPSTTFLAAAGGGFVGAIVGAVAATTMMGDPDNGQASLQTEQNEAVQVAVVED